MKQVLPLIIFEAAGEEAEEFVAKIMRNRQEAFAIYHSLLTDSLISRFPELPAPSEIANFVMETLFYWANYTNNSNCPCYCHPSLPNSNLHTFGFECPCMHDAARDELPQPTPIKPTSESLNLDDALDAILEPAAA